MAHDIRIEELPAQKVIAIKADITAPEIPQVMGSAYGELYQHIAAHGIVPAGPPMAVYSEFTDARIEVEICIPVPDVVLNGDRVIGDELPATVALTMTHIGPYDRLPQAYGEMQHYAEEHHLQLAGPMREQYLNGPPDAKPEEFETRIQWPVVPTGSTRP